MVGLMDWHGFYAFTFGVIAITTLYATHWLFGKWRAYAVTLTCLSMIIIVGECTLAPPQWNRIRGTVMVMTMKMISLAVDLDSDHIAYLPSLPELFGYMFHCATLIFGPWISFYDYYRSLEFREDDKASMDLFDPLWLLSVLRALLLSTMCLVLSACGVHWFFEDVEDYGTWPVAFREAMGFRMSHYFVCFHGESSAVAAGVRRQSARKDELNEWNLEIVRPARIELPRSLVEVVVYWNRPMHLFLKNYVFRRLLPFGGRFLAVLGTFAASALLHGLSFRLAAVLLSLGFYIHVEYVLREKLASIFSACIGARECHSCAHKNTPSTHWWVWFINGVWTTVAIANLAYLGTMFDDDQPTDVEEKLGGASTGATMQYTLKKWSELGFASHWLVLAMFAFNYLL
ncbi:protein-cysteine N-palmitoyltransferase porcupine-like [Tropilaelaps mercedesae]|uniref:Protein-serine O-palmitoleoyltransferase porcupine n=1 Tax=Tropilaelaps mercedesae TaxID=418985 RepID=A0A1V9XNT7_9ACAR|nr:protein-cysteine N-palmitoyltransferase porcupine-like [Tropilaelaps mercedesae]